MSCCPPGSLGAASTPLLSSASPKGHVITIQPQQQQQEEGSQGSSLPPPMNCYCTGAPLSSSVKHIVFVFTDVFGYEAGNHKAFADTLADRLGYMMNDDHGDTATDREDDKDDTKKKDGPSTTTTVLMPDLFRGNPIIQPVPYLPPAVSMMTCLPFILYRMKYKNGPERIERDITDLIVPWLRKEGVDVDNINLSCVGFCFGGWVVGRALLLKGKGGEGMSLFKCGVGIHPSFKPENFHGGTPDGLAAKIGPRPILLLPGKNDPDGIKPGGSVVKILASARGENVSEEDVSVEFPTMIHGWVSRGDSTNTEIRENQEKAILLTIDFLMKHNRVTFEATSSKSTQEKTECSS